MIARKKDRKKEEKRKMCVQYCERKESGGGLKVARKPAIAAE